MRIDVDHACEHNLTDRLAGLSATVDQLLSTWHGPDAGRFEELWTAWEHAARLVCSSLTPRPARRVPRPRASPDLDLAPVTPTRVLAQMHVWQQEVAYLARSGDGRAGLAEMVTALARLRGVVPQAG